MFYVTQDVQHRFELDLNLKVFRNLNMDHSNKGYVKIYARTVCQKKFLTGNVFEKKSFIRTEIR